MRVRFIYILKVRVAVFCPPATL